MGKDTNLNDIYEELQNIKNRMAFLNISSMLYDEAVIEGKIDLKQDEIFARDFLNKELEIKFDEVLSNIKELF